MTPAAKKARGRVLPMRPAPPLPVHPFDHAHGTDTGGLIPGAVLASGHPSDAHLTAYYATAPSILEALIGLWLRSRPLAPIDRTAFVDIGAGKGRVVMLASEHPFREVAGIELNPALAELAERNLARFLESPAAAPLAPARILAGDALAVPLPDAPVLFFLFHPFEAPLLQRLLARLKAHYGPGGFDLVYANAEHAGLLDRDPGFVRLFNGMVPMSPDDHLADLLEIAEQKEYGSTGDEFCTLYRRV